MALLGLDENHRILTTQVACHDAMEPVKIPVQWLAMCSRSVSMDSMHTMEEINALNPADFVRVLGGVFEHSPWIAAAVETQRPFPDCAALHEAMVHQVTTAGDEKQLALIQAHPDLAGRLARQGQLTAESQREQSSAGLTAADVETLARIESLNHQYRSKFGFPFIICARLNKVETIVAAMETRVHHSAEAEMAIALEEIAKIAQLRLKDLIQD
jgi:2-oxo-4-hydroxy-4-carboxy-5-ureidoimidazoline decarboxylase